MSTLLCEELVGFGKNSKKQRGATVFRKPEVSMAMMLGNIVPSKRFRYEQTEDSTAPPSKRVRLPPEAFGRGAKQSTVVYKGLVSSSAKPPWFSPGAPQIGINTADLSLLRYAQATEQYDQLGQAFLSSCASGQSFIFKRVLGSPEENDIATGWVVGLANFGDSSAIVWPVDLQYMSTSKRVVQFRAKLRAPEMMPILSWHNLVAIPFTWRSPLWFNANFPLASRTWHMQVRPVVDLADEAPLATVAARQSWWALDVRELKKVSQHLGIVVDPGASLFDALTAMTCKVLGISESEALEYLGGRLRAHDDPECVEELLQIDEASNLLHRNDEEDLHREKKKQAADRDSDTTFYREYSAVKKKYRPVAMAPAKPGRRKKESGSQVLRVPPGDVIDLASAKELKPPGSFVWRAWSHGAWEGRLPPHKVVRRSWSGGSAGIAFKLLLQVLWDQYLKDEGLEQADCPIVGLYDS